MLNANPGVKLVAEPLLSVAGRKVAPALELGLLQRSVTALEKNRSHRIVGFNEKLLPGRYSIPSNETATDLLKQYLISRNFK
jgi:hypothetical protein